MTEPEPPVSIVCNGHRVGQREAIRIIGQIEAIPLHQLLTGQGFHLRPIRLPRGLAQGNLRIRLTWKKTAGAEVQIVRFTHYVIAPTAV